MVKDIKAEKCIEEIDGHKIEGYKFRGVHTQSVYFIKNDDKLDVYRFNNGNWNRRCIVDQTGLKRIFEDRLANRLLNIYNEPGRLRSFLGV